MGKRIIIDEIGICIIFFFLGLVQISVFDIYFLQNLLFMIEEFGLDVQEYFFGDIVKVWILDKKVCLEVGDGGKFFFFFVWKLVLFQYFNYQYIERERQYFLVWVWYCYVGYSNDKIFLIGGDKI